MVLYLYINSKSLQEYKQYQLAAEWQRGSYFNSPINFYRDTRSNVMQRTMVFIDYQNFNINLKKHYENSKNFNRIDYLRLVDTPHV